MANHTYSKGLLYKKTLNSSGEVTGSVPLLLKTLGSLVIMSDGTDAETAISTAISNMVTPDETTIVTGQDGITISVKKSTSAEIDEILGDVPTSHTWEGYYTKSETEALIDAVDDKISQSGIETALGYTPIPTTAKGSNNGVAELDSAGKVPASQLPSYVDDVIESATYAALPATGESGKIYVTLNDDKTYRWSGSAYVEISASLALGETSSTAYRGDRGKTAYDHSQAAHARTDATNAAIVSGKLNINGTATNIGDFKAVSTVASQGLTDTEKSNALANIGAVPNSDFVVATNNINYAINTGVKNTFNLLEWCDPGIYSTVNGLNARVMEDGRIHIYGTMTAQNNTDLSVKGSYTSTAVIYTTPTSDSYTLSAATEGNVRNSELHFYSKNTGPYDDGINLSSGTDSKTLHTQNYTWLMVRVPATTSAVDFYVTPMVSLTSFNDISFQSYARTNSNLTILEAEDRASLAEVVDSGAKNIAVPSLFGDVTGLTITQSNGHYVVSGTTTAAFTHYIYNPPTPYVCTETMVALGAKVATGMSPMVQYVDPENTRRYIPITTGSYITIPAGSSIEKIYFQKQGSASLTVNVDYYMMLCTKAAFGVSSKFVPYRPNWDLVAEAAFSCGFHGGTVNSGDLNAISTSEFRLYNDPTNLPSGQSGYFFVQTIIFDRNSGYQEITALTQNGETYKRMLYGGTWRAWKQITMT